MATSTTLRADVVDERAGVLGVSGVQTTVALSVSESPVSIVLLPAVGPWQATVRGK